MSNILFCISGPSGSGKTTVMRNIMNNELLSFTTRPMREGEIQGQDYLFITREEFDELFNEGVLAEWTEYDGKYYGLTMEELLDKLEHENAFFICDNHGFNQIKEKYNNIVSIFLYADVGDCSDNMFYRGDNEERVNGRLNTYYEELAKKGQYDYVVKNTRGYLQATETIVRNIVNVETLKNMDRNKVEQ
jgi:guanylate kinase